MIHTFIGNNLLNVFWDALRAHFLYTSLQVATMASEKSSMYWPRVACISNADYRGADRSRVFFDIEISHEKKGRVVFELVRPKTLSLMRI